MERHEHSIAVVNSGKNQTVCNTYRGALNIIVNSSIELLVLLLQRDNPPIFRQRDRDRTK